MRTPIPPWVEAVFLFLIPFVIIPAIAAVIGHAAWVGKPKKWDRSMYWAAFVASVAATGFLMVYAQRMQTDVGTWRYPTKMLLLGAELLFGVAAGCGVGIFIYGRGKGPTWRRATPRPENSTDDMENDHHSDG